MTIDYRKKYLKYKIKYLEIKEKKQHKKMKGGELKIEEDLDKIMGAMKIDNDDFVKLIKNNTDDILVIIYAHWCYHCVNMIKNIGNDLKSNSNSNRIKYLDGTKLTEELKEKLEIQGFPTIIKIRGNDINNLNKKEYEGPREVADIINFLEDKS